MGEVEVFQIHIENVIVIGYFNVVLVALAVRPRFGAVAYLYFFLDRQDILFLKEHFKGALHFIECKHALMPRGKDRN